MTVHSTEVPASSAQFHDASDCWYAMRPEARSGTLRFVELRQLAVQGQLRPDDLVWRVGWKQWFPARTVMGLFPLTSPPVPATSKNTVSDDLRDGSSRRSNLKARAKHEMRAYLIITVYVWAVLLLLRLHETVIVSAYNLDLQSHGLLIIKALIIGKVVLIAEAVKVGERLPHITPASSILVKSALFAVAILGFQALEEIVSAVWEGNEIIGVLPEVNGADIKRGLTFTSIVTLTMLPYFIIKEIEKITNRKELLFELFGRQR